MSLKSIFLFFGSSFRDANPAATEVSGNTLVLCDPRNFCPSAESLGCFALFLLQEGIEDGAVVFLLGNKMDTAGRETRSVPKMEGERLAKVSLCALLLCLLYSLPPAVSWTGRELFLKPFPSMVLSLSALTLIQTCTDVPLVPAWPPPWLPLFVCLLLPLSSHPWGSCGEGTGFQKFSPSLALCSTKVRQSTYPKGMVFLPKHLPLLLPSGHSVWAFSCWKCISCSGKVGTAIAATLLAPRAASRVSGGKVSQCPGVCMYECWGRVGSWRRCLLCSLAGIQGCLLWVQRYDWL